MGKVGIIIWREYITRIRKRSFIIMSFFGPILIAGVVLFSLWLSLDGPEDQRILVVDDNYPLFSKLNNSKAVSYDHKQVSLDQAIALLETSDYTGILYLPKNILHSSLGDLYFKKQPAFRIQRQMEEQIQQYIELHKIKELNISETDYRRIKSPFEMRAFRVDGTDAEQTDMTPAIVGLVFSIMIYMFIFIYSVQVMRGVIEEKSNRIVEVIISSVKPFQLMLGKIIGVGAVGLTQFLLWSFLSLSVITIGQIAVVGSMYDVSDMQSTSMTEQLSSQVDAPAINIQKMSQEDNVFNSFQRINMPLMIAMFIFYFLGGYLLYSAMMAAVGSASDNDTDTQQFILPITFPLLLAYIVSFTIFDNPSGSLAVWMSIIPFTSPVIMMIRVAVGIPSGELWQVGLSMVSLIATFLLMVWLSARVYRTGILMYGKKVTLRELLRWIKR